MPEKNHSPVNSILILYNAAKSLSREALDIAKKYLFASGIKFHIAEHLQMNHDGTKDDAHIPELTQNCDAVLVLGGDGTILGAARRIVDSPRPLLGINLGGFGFLTACGFDEIGWGLECLLSGKYNLVKRHLLEAKVIRPSAKDHQERFRSYAMNEALVTLLHPGRLLDIWVGEDEKNALAYRADGLIVATPTGSTGHSLSAGGPILEPHLPALVITPVSPHSLFNRPLVFDGEQEFRIWFREGAEKVGLILDGQVQTTLLSTDRIQIRRLKRTIPTVSLPDRSFSQILRVKFNLGEGSQGH
ncbi:MAG: NAD(+)/NADH kinase [Candidatus Omnitrophota bacterium]